ncbi:MAG: hypothetical protein A2176_06565 [Spirochaetes bacterium RBG_13_51_14]|nr:MAG: hypothetical protein A2176_06565 [Spirochaetes bacterium RBG_13_51_14]
MRKFTLLFLAVLIAFGIAFRPIAAHAVEAKVGLNMMYDWWKPAFLAFENETAGKLYQNNRDTTITGSFMMGPMFWVKVAPDWNIGGQLLFGLVRNEFEYETLAIDFYPSPRVFYDIGTSKIRRYDLDLYAEHPIHKYFNLLIGMRFNYDSGESDSYIFGYNLIFPFRAGVTKEIESSAWYLGPSAGAAFHYEFIKGLELNASVSLLLQGGRYDAEKKYLYISPIWVMYPNEYKVGYFCIGLDNNVKLSYFIQPAHLEVWLGLRYIVLPHISAGDEASKLDLLYEKDWISGEVEHLINLYLGAAYKF